MPLLANKAKELPERSEDLGQSERSADVLRQFDDDPLRTADITESVAVLVALQFSDEFSAAGSQAGDYGIDVFDRECDVSDTEPVRRRVAVATLGRRRVEFRQFESSVAVRGLQHRDICPDAFESYNAIHPASLDPPLSLKLKAKFDEEFCGCREIINHDADVLHPFDLRWLRLFGQVFRVLSGKIVQSSSWRWECENRFHRFQGLVGRAENSTIVFRAFHMTGISTACFVAR